MKNEKQSVQLWLIAGALMVIATMLYNHYIYEPVEKERQRRAGEPPVLQYMRENGMLRPGY